MTVRKPSPEVASLSACLSAQTPPPGDHEGTETWCVVATQSGKDGRGHFIYATAQTQGGARTMATGLVMRGTTNKQGYLRAAQNVRVLKLDTPEYRAADYMMSPAERETALECARIF